MRGIELLGDIVDDIGILHRHFDAFAEITVSLDVRRDSDVDENTADLFVQAGLSHLGREVLARKRRRPGDLPHALLQELKIEGLYHVIARSLVHRLRDDLFPHKRT